MREHTCTVKVNKRHHGVIYCSSISAKGSSSDSESLSGLSTASQIPPLRLFGWMPQARVVLIVGSRIQQMHQRNTCSTSHYSIHLQVVLEVVRMIFLLRFLARATPPCSVHISLYLFVNASSFILHWHTVQG